MLTCTHPSITAALAGILTFGLTIAPLGAQESDTTATCDELAVQARTLAGDWLKGKEVAKSPGLRQNTRTTGGVPRIVAVYQKKPAARVGGEDAKARQLERLWALYRRERRKLDAAHAMMGNAEARQPAVLDRMAALDCPRPNFLVVSEHTR